MTILDQLEQVEKAATAGPWWMPVQSASPETQVFAMLLRNHAADLIAVARLAREIEEQAAASPERVVDEVTRHKLWNALVPLLADEGETA